MFDRMDPLDSPLTSKVSRAITQDPMKAVPATQKAVQKWALEGGSPSEFANRYEYASAKFNQAKNAALRPGTPNTKANAEAAAEPAVTPEKLTADLSADIKRIQDFGPGEHVRSSSRAPAEIGAEVQGMKRIAFESDTAEAYHAVKNQDELPPEFTPAGRDPVESYHAAYDDTIKTGTVTVTKVAGATKVVIQKTYAGIDEPMEAIIYVKPDGTTVLATYKAVN